MKGAGFTFSFFIKALKHQASKNTTKQHQNLSVIFCFSAKSSMFFSPFGLLSSTASSLCSGLPYKTALHAHSTLNCGHLARFTSCAFDVPCLRMKIFSHSHIAFSLYQPKANCMHLYSMTSTGSFILKQSSEIPQHLHLIWNNSAKCLGYRIY